jgi:hypothetical protein
MKWYWLSFANPDTGENLGCCNVEAETEFLAVKKTHILGINPGGEVMIVPMDKPELIPDKLVSKTELYANGYTTMRKEAEKRNVPVDSLPHKIMCSDCNQIDCDCHN